MKKSMRTLLLLSFWIFVGSVNAEVSKETEETNFEYVVKPKYQLESFWFWYFNGSILDIDDYTGRQGFDNDVDYPFTYRVAIRIPADDTALKGKMLSRMGTAFWDLNYISDVYYWVSTFLPNSYEDADIISVNLPTYSISTDQASICTITDPIMLGNTDIYVGYEFRVSSSKNPRPLMVDNYSDKTKPNAFYLQLFGNWKDLAGENFGNPMLMLYIEPNSILGDANSDGDVDVLDVTCAIDYIFTETTDINFEMTDIDGDYYLDILDVEMIVDIILERYDENVYNEQAYANDRLYAAKTNEGISVRMDADNKYRGFQMDVLLPEGASIDDITLDSEIASTHRVKYVKKDGNRYRVIVTSINGNAFDAKNLLNITSSSNDIKIENIVFATSEMHKKCFDQITMGDVTAIENAQSDNAKIQVRHIDGTKANADNLQKGIYIINGKKVVIK